MKPRWFAYCYTCGRYHVLTSRRRIRNWRSYHRGSSQSNHRVMLYRIDKFTVVS